MKKLKGGIHMKKPQCQLNPAAGPRSGDQPLKIWGRVNGIPTLRYKYVMVIGVTESLARSDPPGPWTGTPTPGSGRMAWSWNRTGCRRGCGPSIFSWLDRCLFMHLLLEINGNRMHKHLESMRICSEYSMIVYGNKPYTISCGQLFV